MLLPTTETTQNAGQVCNWRRLCSPALAGGLPRGQAPHASCSEAAVVRRRWWGGTLLCRKGPCVCLRSQELHRSLSRPGKLHRSFHPSRALRRWDTTGYTQVLARQLSISLLSIFPFHLASTAELSSYRCSGAPSFNNNSAVLLIYLFTKRETALY